MKRSVLAVCIAGLLLAACGGKARPVEGLREEVPCPTTAAPIADPRFPEGFPAIANVTWTASDTAGPTQIIQGYSSDSLDELFSAMTTRFSSGAYKVEKDERDPHDAEVNFTGTTNRGQVRLAEECRGRRSVVITIRPKD